MTQAAKCQMLACMHNDVHAQVLFLGQLLSVVDGNETIHRSDGWLIHIM